MTLLRLARRLFSAVAGLIALFLLLSVAGAVIPGPHPAMDGTAQHRVGLIAGPIHYDLLIPLTPDLRRRFGFARDAGVAVDDPAAEWLIAGWGAQEFYTTVGDYSDLSLRAVWRGLTGDASVMRLDVAGPVADTSGIRFVMMNDAQFAALVDAVLAGFALAPAGAPQPLATPGLSGRDVFFAGRGRFHIGHTCNAWIGETLRAAGLRFGIWTPAPWSVRLSLWWFGT